MIYIIFFLVLSLIISVIKHKSSFTWIFVTMISIVSVLLLTTVFVYVKLSNYYAVFSWERSVYFILSKIKINYYSLFDIFIIAITGYLLTGVIFVFRVIWVSSAKRFFAGITALTLPVMGFLILNIYQTCIRIYFAMQQSHSAFLDFFVQNISRFNLAVIVVYTVLPFLAIAWAIYHTKIHYKRKHLSIISFYLLTIDIIAGIVLLGVMPYQSLLFYAPDFLRIPSAINLDSNENTIMILLVCVLFFVAFSVFAVTKKLFDNVDLSTRYIRPHPIHTKVSFEDTRGIFHTCKNMLLSLDFLAKGMEYQSPPAEIQESIREMHSLIGDSLTRLTHLLNIYNAPMEIVDYVDLEDCIADAVEKVNCPDGIEVSFDVQGEKACVYADNILLEEAFVNLIKNSCEAILQKNQACGQIEVRIFTEGDWACVYIRDNGCGIHRKHYTKVFKPLFSTKKTAQNWGVGLSFVSNVMASLGGKISVQSVLGEYTEFELLFPLGNRTKHENKKVGRAIKLLKIK